MDSNHIDSSRCDKIFNSTNSPSQGLTMCHQVTNAWPGWKQQLARPFYCDSSWKEGWLLELRGTRNADDEWNEGFKYCDEAQYVFWLPQEQHGNYFILSKLPCHFGSYLWDALDDTYRGLNN